MDEPYRPSLKRVKAPKADDPYEPVTSEDQVQVFTSETMPDELRERIAKAKWGLIEGDSDPRPFGDWAKTVPGLEEEVAQVIARKRRKMN